MAKCKSHYKVKAKTKRHNTIRKKIVGTKERPRLVVYRSLKNIYAQIIDDQEHKTLLAVSNISKEFDKEIKGKKTEISFKVGLLLGEKALATGIKTISFDRGGYLYHGRVKALAEGARKAGLIF